MSNVSPTTGTEDAFCLGCGYPLRKLPAHRCPECGRRFDPADPRTMSLFRPLRPWQRWLLRPTGWPTISLALIGTAALAWLSRWPRLSLEPPSVLLDEFHWPRPYTMPPTVPDIVFYAAVVLWAAFIAWVVLWRLPRVLLVPRAARRANVWGIDTRRRRPAIAAAAIVSVVCMIFGWESRVGRRWMARAMAPTPPRTPYGMQYDPRFDPWRQSPVALSPAQAKVALSAFVVDLPSSNERLHALGLLVEAAGRATLPSIVRAARAEHDPDLLAWELRLIGLCRDPATATLLIEHLTDTRAEARAAAADAIGILRHPTYSVYVPNGFWMVEPLALGTAPPIPVEGLVATSTRNGYYRGGYAEHDLRDEAPIAIDSTVRNTLERMMLASATAAEREAAARALVDWPPDHYRLRVAEWGVWISNAGHMALAKSVLDEIPPFAHRTGNPTASFGSYFLYPSAVTKPIVHLSSSVPLAVDVESQISEGRPWFGYPMPDDFAIGSEDVNYRVIGAAGGLAVFPASRPAPDDFTAPAIPSLPDCREGYPWLVPHHRVRWSNGTSFGGPALIACLGLRWQSLIVSPNRLPWMAPPPVPSDPRFRWWARLRDVPSSWVSSRGETERFLYYDGPTRAAVPLAVILERSGRQIRFTAPRPPQFGYGGRGQPEPHFHPLAVGAPSGLPEHEGLYIEVHSGGVRARAMVITGDGSIPVDFDPALNSEPAVAGALRQMLLRYGLSGPEADGLIAAWAPQFFRAQGRRFVLRMSPAEYARQCPMQVRPPPTEVVRLGLVLSEFDPPNTATTRPTVR